MQPKWIKGEFYIPDSLLRKYDFFELYPLDGGASFIFDEFLGTRKDKPIADGLMKGDILKHWCANGKIDWKKYAKLRYIEMTCFLNRLYFLAPLCRMYYLTKNEKYAKKFFEIAADWERSIGYPPTRKAFIELEKLIRKSDESLATGTMKSFNDPADWEWYDFQPAQRLLVLLWCAYFLKGSKALEEHQDKLYYYITYHAQNIYWTATDLPIKYDNHFSLRMLVLYMASVLIDHPDSEKWRKFALKMQVKSIRHEFHPNGINVEGVPAYFPFIITHFRDVLIASKANGFSVPASFKAMVFKSIASLKALSMPDGHLPVINDGPRVNITAVLELMKVYFPKEMAKYDKTINKNLVNLSGFAVFRDKKNYLIFDSNYAIGGHVHAGKLGFILWRENDPFIIEAGCCNYDNPDFQPYYRRGGAHSTLLVNGQEDAIWKAFWEWSERARPVIKLFKSGKENVIKSESDGFKRFGIKFSRMISQESPDRFIITDEVKNNGKNNKFTFRFMTYKKKIEQINKNLVRLTGKKSVLEIKTENVSGLKITNLKTNLFAKVERVKALDFTVNSSKDFKQSFSFTFK